MDAELITKQLGQKVMRMEHEIAKHMVGQKDLVRQILICMLTGGNVLLEGVPGLGKTRLIKVLGKIMDLKFSRIQFTPDLMPSDVVGTNIIVKNERDESVFKFQPGPVFSNIVLADEINRATPKTQSALLEAMQEGTVTAGRSSYIMPQPFFVLATQNPIEMDGTYPLPEAQLDRFIMKINVPFPNLEELRDIVTMTSATSEAELEKVCDGDEILAMRKVVRQIPVANPVMNFALKLVLATHPESLDAPAVTKKYLRFGASPRAAQAIIQTAQVRAILEGRWNVSFEDIQYVAKSTLRHRIFLNFEAISDGMNAEKLVDLLIVEVEKSIL